MTEFAITLGLLRTLMFAAAAAARVHRPVLAHRARKLCTSGR